MNELNRIWLFEMYSNEISNIEKSIAVERNLLKSYVNEEEYYAHADNIKAFEKYRQTLADLAMSI